VSDAHFIFGIAGSAGKEGCKPGFSSCLSVKQSRRERSQTYKSSDYSCHACALGETHDSVKRALFHQSIMDISHTLVKPYTSVTLLPQEDTSRSLRNVCLSEVLSHHARGVVSGVWVSASVVAEESKSSMLLFQGISTFSTTIGGSRKTTISVL